MTARIEVAKALLSMAKTYTNSLHYREQYMQWWRETEPAKPKTALLRLKVRQAQQAAEEIEYQRQLSELHNQIAVYSDYQFTQAGQAAIKQLESTHVPYALSPAMQPTYHDSIVAARELEQYQIKYPEWLRRKDYKYLIRTRLQRYLDVLAKVDFDTPVTISATGYRQFVIEEIRDKPAEWKSIYRAGREINAVTKPIVEQWLKELD
jgi:hypothetical protein